MRDFIARRGQFLVFVAGGVLCAAVDIAIMRSLIVAGVTYPLATSAGFASGLLLNYAYHARLTFRAPASPRNFLRFMCVVGINYGITLACVAAAVALLPLAVESSSLIGKLLSLPIVAINGFLLSKHWIFN